MNKTQRELRRLRGDMRAAQRDIDNIKAMLERERRIDLLIGQMKRSARQMLLLSRGL